MEPELHHQGDLVPTPVCAALVLRSRMDLEGESQSLDEVSVFLNVKGIHMTEFSSPWQALQNS